MSRSYLLTDMQRSKWSRIHLVFITPPLNYKLLHAMSVSGMLPVQYDRFVRAANIGTMSLYLQKQYMLGHDEAVIEEYNKCIQESITATCLFDCNITYHYFVL